VLRLDDLACRHDAAADRMHPGAIAAMPKLRVVMHL
jgi:hypothetical protein